MSDTLSQLELQVEPGKQVLHVDGVPVVELVDPSSRGELAPRRILIVEGYDEVETAALALIIQQMEGNDDIDVCRAEDMLEQRRTVTIGSDQEANGVTSITPEGRRQLLFVGPRGLVPSDGGIVQKLIRERDILNREIYPILAVGPEYDGLPNRDRWGKQRPPRRGHKSKKRRN